MAEKDYKWSSSGYCRVAAAAILDSNVWSGTLSVQALKIMQVRIRLLGCKGFFISEEDIFWNWMDFVIVLLGVFDLWAIPVGDLILGTKTSNGFGRLVLLVRMLRMLRILRLLKLVKAVRPLYSLALGVTQAMQSIFWVLVFLVVTLYAFAILATRLLGHSHYIQESNDLPVASKELFCSIWDSMFALFSIMNQQNWEAMGPLLEKVPAIKPVYVLFTICSSWALLSVLTGVVSDNMMAVREQQSQKDEEAVEERRIWLARWLRGVFAAADKDGSMALERSEYRELLKSPFHLKRLQQVAKVPMQDLMQMFDILDVDHNGLIEFQEFLVGFEWLNEPISGKSLLKLGHEIRVSCQAVEKLLRGLSEDLNRLCSRQLDQQMRLENRMREVVEARRKLKEECDKTLMAQAKAYEARAELSGIMEQYKVITMSEADENDRPEEDFDADVVIQTPTNNKSDDGSTIVMTSMLKTESMQAQASPTSRFEQDRSKSTSKASSYAMMPDDDDVNPSLRPLGGGFGAAPKARFGRSQSRLDGG
ncbi:SCN1A [Symbiodinium pilosum]|uniref:SCN1A protein n=1 Tax=Symbiodinium pilosum TaxID=2952 RepID=A0A812LXM0_SYMPI|nr:SCN1A [Symbiodinium pilosum]